jgi:hypothetical protein
MDEQKMRQVVREELAFMIKNKKLVFPFPIQILDGNDITIGQTVGTRIGSTGSKIGFFGATPIPKTAQGVLIQRTGGATQDAEARAGVADINYFLAQYGFHTFTP